MKTKLTIIFLISLLVFSCKKKEIENKPVNNTPIFVAEGAFDGNPISLIAGDNNAYMYSYTENINGVNKFSGKLSDGETEIEFGIFDGNIDSYPLSFLENEFNTLSWATESNSPLAILSKNSFLNSDKIDKIEWYSNNNHLGTNSITINEPGKYNILAIVTFTDGSHSSLMNEIILGYKLNSNFTLRFNLFPNGDVNAWADVDNGEIETVIWTIDNEVIEESDGNIITNIDNQTHEITAKVRFKNGVVRTKSIHVDGSFEGKNISDFSNCELSTLNKQTIPRDFKALLIVKKNNIEYRSDYSGNQSGAVEIKKIEYYGQNTNGKQVFNITSTISTNLKNMNTNAIVPVNFETVLGIEMP